MQVLDLSPPSEQKMTEHFSNQHSNQASVQNICTDATEDLGCLVSSLF